MKILQLLTRNERLNKVQLSNHKSSRTIENATQHKSITASNDLWI